MVPSDRSFRSRGSNCQWVLLTDSRPGRTDARQPEASQPRARASRPLAMTRRWISLVPSPMTISGASR